MGCIQKKLEGSPSVNHGGSLWIRLPEKANRNAASHSVLPFKMGAPNCFQSQTEKWPTWQGQAISLPVKKMDFLRFHCGWKCNISVCNFNFTADWHLQRQRILIKPQKHLIQWLADGEKVWSNSIFLTVNKTWHVLFKARTLFHLQFKSDD